MTQIKRLVQLGPFDGGLNLKDASNPLVLNEKQRYCPWLLNLDPYDDKLHVRRGNIRNNAAAIFNPTGTDTVVIEGPFRSYYTNEDFPVGVKIVDTGSDTCNLFFSQGESNYQGNDTPFNTLSAAKAMAFELYLGMFQYQNLLFVVGVTNAGAIKIYRSDTMAVQTATWTLLTGSFPTGFSVVPITEDQLFVWKDRIWLWDKVKNTMFFSKPTDPSVWAVPDGGFFKVGDTDYDPMTAVVTTRDIMYIFKPNSTYEFYYYNDPNTDGFIKLLSTSLGASHAVVYKDSIYVINPKGFFLFDAGQFEDIGQAINFQVNTGALIFPNPRLLVVNDQIRFVNVLFAVDADSRISQAELVYLPDYEAFTIYDLGSSYRNNIFADGHPTIGVQCSWGFTGYNMGQSDERALWDTFNGSTHAWSIPWQLFTPFISLEDAQSYKQIRNMGLVYQYENLDGTIGGAPLLIAWYNLKFGVSRETGVQDISSIVDTVSLPNEGNGLGRNCFRPPKTIPLAKLLKFKNASFALWSDQVDLGLITSNPYLTISISHFLIDLEQNDADLKI